MSARQAAAEFLGTAVLLAIVVGSGIMGERLAAGNAAVALLANSIATGAGLFVLICALGPISGAHFNPAVSIGFALGRHLPWPRVVTYGIAQVAGAIAAAAAPTVPMSRTRRLRGMLVSMAMTSTSSKGRWPSLGRVGVIMIRGPCGFERA